LLEEEKGVNINNGEDLARKKVGQKGDLVTRGPVGTNEKAENLEGRVQ